jgi:hypothetical protein
MAVVVAVIIVLVASFKVEIVAPKRGYHLLG